MVKFVLFSSVPGNIQGEAGWGFDHTDRAVGVHYTEVGLDDF